MFRIQQISRTLIETIKGKKAAKKKHEIRVTFLVLTGFWTSVWRAERSQYGIKWRWFI